LEAELAQLRPLCSFMDESPSMLRAALDASKRAEAQLRDELSLKEVRDSPSQYPAPIVRCHDGNRAAVGCSLRLQNALMSSTARFRREREEHAVTSRQLADVTARADTVTAAVSDLTRNLNAMQVP
jgi:hypothetical protein